MKPPSNPNHRKLAITVRDDDPQAQNEADKLIDALHNLTPVDLGSGRGMWVPVSMVSERVSMQPAWRHEFELAPADKGLSDGRLEGVSEVAARAAIEILPDHFHLDEDNYYSCGMHPEAGSAKLGKPCDCNLEARRRAVAVIVDRAIRDGRAK